MPAKPPQNIRCGTIICAQAQHPTGRGRDLVRFYLVISPTEENSKSAVCLGISRQCPDPPPSHAELLPFDANPQSRPMTGLKQRSAVFVDWSIEIQLADIVNRRVGYIRQDLFDRIMKKLQHHLDQ